MNLFINDEAITVFNGATVKDAIRAFYVQHNKKLPNSLPIITDGYGNNVAPDGELTEGNHLYLKI
jgi:hypothetical protein